MKSSLTKYLSFIIACISVVVSFTDIQAQNVIDDKKINTQDSIQISEDIKKMEELEAPVDTTVIAMQSDSIMKASEEKKKTLDT